MKQYMIAIMTLTVFFAAGFVIPSLLFEWKDMKRLKSLELKASEEVVLTSQTNMTIVEKILLMQSSMANIVEMETGKNYTEEGMIVHAQKEIKTLSELGILEVDRTDLVYGIDGINFLIDIQGGTKSMLIWEVTVKSKDGNLLMMLDDETGKVLTITQMRKTTSIVASESIAILESGSSNEYQGNLDSVAKKWAQYWGVELVQTTVYDQTIVSGYDEMLKEIDLLVEKGISVEQAMEKVYEEWGVVDSDMEGVIERRLYATYEDEGDIAVMGFRKNTGDIVFMIYIYV